MQQQDPCERLARALNSCLAQGVHPEPDVRHYIDSTFAHPTHQELNAILKDPGDCERDTLLELIFFPGLDMQIQLEDLIEQSKFQPGDENVILGMLMRKRPTASLYHPKGSPPVSFAVPEHAAGTLITRLKIHKRINSRVRDAVRQNLPLDWQVPARVMVRNARFLCRGDKAVFLETFMRNIPAVTEDFFGLVKFVLDFLETSPDGIALKEALAHRKQQHSKNIIKADQFERQRQNRNVETMIIQGIRIPHIDPRDDMRKIAMIDTVSLAIYGIIP